MLSLVKVEPAVTCEGDNCPHGKRGHTATNHLFLFGHSYLRLCLDCVLEHAAIWEEHGGTVDVEKLQYDASRHIREHAERAAA